MYRECWQEQEGVVTKATSNFGYKSLACRFFPGRGGTNHRAAIRHWPRSSPTPNAGAAAGAPTPRSRPSRASARQVTPWECYACRLWENYWKSACSLFNTTPSPPRATASAFPRLSRRTSDTIAPPRHSSPRLAHERLADRH